ncbi:Ser-Thr-rich glycosyl-phosphatidyl-inositol-anchored membrane family-domain-containing protein [Apodospora peruviana]|uniref:Ser-Thr-rich glycosyl-phosphatidyl-inositol-anchored membrane family-domain-containing protein n=1 Tax=Apodospora peruviana TaxID=516989 RepID=A0AAE0IRJ8_9PEZI|nr:Ser-Thr-rich glycosyl-phosphatidyl-inositol-anchored membrane family-domain-containing protein [Apodospora peruviana]
MRFFQLLALAAPLVSAIEFTSPAANATLSKGEVYDLSWTTVDTDPSTFSIYLVNFFNWPPSYTPVAMDVETAAGAASVTVPCSVDSSWGFQFNAINGTNVYVIYAQTPKFYISGGPCEDPTPSGPTCAAATVTVTVSSTRYGNSTAAPSYTAAPSPGKCPDTIGWGESGYSYPVTLTSVPHGSYPAGVDAPAPTDGPVYSSKKGYLGSTSTIYQTVYKDLSEVEHEGCAC